MVESQFSRGPAKIKKEKTVEIPLPEADFFRYSDKQWARIEAELPNVLPDDVTLDKMRIWLEAQCGSYRIAVFAIELHKREKIELRRFATEAQNMLDKWPETLMPARYPSDHQSEKFAESEYVKFRNIVGWLQEKANSSRKPRKGPNPFGRDLLVCNLIWDWARLGCSVGASTSADGMSAGGPLVRFLLAAANPVLEKEMTANAARTLVRKYKKYNSPPFDESKCGWWSRP
jgi:hypothetical protein